MKNKFSYFLIALVIAFGLWIYVVTTVSPESEEVFHNIPVEWETGSDDILKDKGLMVVSGSKPTVTLRLRGNRSDLNKLKNSDITIIANLAKINHAGEQSLSYDVYFTGNGGTNAFEIVNQNPSVLTLQIAEWATKDVQVVVNYTGTLGLDYIAYKDDVILTPNVITITGPKSVVDQVAQARINVDLTDQTETINRSYRATLCNSKGEPVDVASVTANGDVQVTLRILRVKELRLEITPKYGSVVTEENSSWVLSHTTIKVAGSDKLLANLPDVLNLGEIDLTKITANTTETIPITEGMLQGAENLSGITEVTVTITVPERTSRELYIPKDQIRVSGLPEGMNLEIVPNYIKVTLIGWAYQVSTITAEDLVVTIDATDAEANGDQFIAASARVTKYPGVIATVEAVPVNITEGTGGNP